MLMNSWTLLRLKTSLLERVKSLELELYVAREQIDRTSTSKLGDMLHIQKSIFDKTGLGFVESGSTPVMNPLKFVPATSSYVVHPTLFEVKVHKEVVPASRRTRVDLSESKPKNSNKSKARKIKNLSGFVTFVVELGIQGQIVLSCKI